MSRTSSELNIILRAGAGAGKTTRLTQEFLQFSKDFKNEHGHFPRIVVTTFTRKATQELKERLLAKALQENREDLFRYVSSKSKVQISTIHGVLSLFLSRYGSAVGLTPDYRIMADSEIRRGARRILRKHLLENEDLQELLEEYDFSVLESISLQYFNQNIVQSKMRFITSPELEAETSRILQENKSQFIRLCREIQSQTANEKWQHYCDEALNFSWKKNEESWELFFTRLESFWEHLSKPVFRKTSAPFSLGLHEELTDVIERIEALLSYDRFRPLFWQRHQRNCDLFERLAEKFSIDFLHSKISQGLLSMGDLETLTIKVLREAPEAALKFSQEWDFWMIDEYQDTSPVQVHILRQLIGDRRFFIVGDPQQSIYLFRGARSEVFQQKEKEVEELGGKLETKLTNYRSTPEVLEFLNLYFTSLSGNRFVAMSPAPEKEKSHSSSPIALIQITETSDADPVSMEILATVARIQDLLKQGVAPGQICVLGRTHKTLQDIAKVSQEYGIPLLLHSGSSFYERREVLDALAILKFLLNPHDNANFIALLRSPWFYVEDSELMNYCHHRSHSYWIESLRHLSGRHQNHPLNSLLVLLKYSEEKGLSWTLRWALQAHGLFDYSAKIDPTGRREANLWKVVTLLSQEERRPGFNFLDFLNANLETLSTDEGAEDADAVPVIEPQRVNFMTVHASKGLQFDHVIVPGMGQDPRASQSGTLSVNESDGLWSLKIKNQSTQGMEASLLAEKICEELRHRESEEYHRVLYVALTRAKKGITLLWDSQKVGKKSWAALCPINLEEGVHDLSDFSYQVLRQNILPEKMRAEDLATKIVRSPWTFSVNEVQRKSVSVTSLVSGDLSPRTDTAFIQSKMQKEDLGSGLAKAQQGTQAHRFFEALKYSSLEEVSKVADAEIQKALNFLKHCQEIPLLEIIQNGQVEWGFTLNLKDTLLQGQIDLWGIFENSLWVIDYKTGSQRYSEMAFDQLKVYAWALRKMGYSENIESVKLGVVYPLDEIIKTKAFESWGPIDKQVAMWLGEK